jgi:cbb3-type cytochrome oxidase cytochrome c subunit
MRWRGLGWERHHVAVVMSAGQPVPVIWHEQSMAWAPCYSVDAAVMAMGAWALDAEARADEQRERANAFRGRVAHAEERMMAAQKAAAEVSEESRDALARAEHAAKVAAAERALRKAYAMRCTDMLGSCLACAAQAKARSALRALGVEP